VFLAADLIVLALRALVFVATLHAAGTALFLSVFRAQLGESAERVRHLTRGIAVGGLLLVVLEYALTPVRMAGSFSAWLDPSLTDLLAQSNVSTALMVRLVGLALIAVSMDFDNRLNTAIMIAGAVLALLSFGLMGHTTIHDVRWALLPLLLVHLGVAAFWFGALIPLYLLARDEPSAVCGRALTRFSALAKRAIAGIPVAGIAMALLFVRDLGGWATPYGVMILAKAGAFALLMSIAAANAFRFTPRILAGDGRALGQFRKSVGAEWILIALVVAGTAVMTSLYSPEGLHGSFGGDHEEEPEH
jgi:putative copper resistance protein D